jgi:hypothetical protein
MQLVEPVVFPEIEVFKRFVEPAFDLIKIEPDSVMPDGYGPVWYPLPAAEPGYLDPPRPSETIEHEGVLYAPRHVLGYMPLQPYTVFDGGWFEG